jgi:hypothetical protein
VALVLALDPGTSTGWAVGAPGDTPLWGSRDFKGGSSGEVMGLFRHWLNQRCYELHPTLIVFEAPYIPQAHSKIPMNAATLRRLLGIVATVEAVGWELRIPVREATTLEIARFFLGTQRLARGAKKAATVEACRRYGWDVSDDNQADALALWAMAECKLAPALSSRRGEGPLFTGNRTPQAASQPGAFLGQPVDAGKTSNGRYT